MPRTTRARARSSEAHPGRIRRKNVNIDQEKLDRVVAHFGARSETDAIDQALDLALFREELIEGVERLAGSGGVENLFDEHPDW